MGGKLVVGGKLNAEGKRACFVWWAFNRGNFRTGLRVRLGVLPFEVSWHADMIRSAGDGSCAHAAGGPRAASARARVDNLMSGKGFIICSPETFTLN